jgi:8-oxo-dGTP pyrophosphatase MutT (NUDIX family)
MMAHSMSSRFERLDAHVVYEARIARIMKGSFRHEDGDVVDREWAELPGSVGVVAHDGERLWLVRQPREATGDFDLLELPAGRLDQEGESPLEAAQRELAEEIGKAAEHWEHLTTFYTTPGFTNEQCHVFLATGLRDEPGRAIDDERIDIETASLADLDDLVAASRDSKTMIGLMLLRERLRADAAP